MADYFLCAKYVFWGEGVYISFIVITVIIIVKVLIKIQQKMSSLTHSNKPCKYCSLLIPSKQNQHLVITKQ